MPRLASVLLAAALLIGCSASRVAAPGGAPEPLVLDEVLGSWAFTAQRGNHRVAGTIHLDEAESRFVIPDMITDPVVRDARLAVANDTLRWSGVVATMGGPTRFETTVTRRGETLVGTNEIAGVGTYDFEATR